VDSARQAPLASHVRRLRRAEGRRFIVALIPARNDGIENAIGSLRAQDTPPDLIVVCADGSAEDTVTEAERAGAVVFETDEHGQAGVLNQALERMLPELWGDDSILVMDADSVLAPSFLGEARDLLGDGIGGVGGVFTRRSRGGFVRILQRNRYASEAALVSVSTIRHVVWARQKGVLPGGTPEVYDARVLTTDGQLTLALLLLGYKVVSPQGRRRTTTWFESWRDLCRQRLRWKRGTLANPSEGVTKSA
jgi:cellulose synthase/poly-beta-1,6-N-acetylglucosamine synthase-like glycosyltransferase